MNKYNGKDLSKTLDTLNELIHKAQMESYETRNENEEIKKSMAKLQFEYSKKCSPKILYGAQNLIGRTIKRVIQIGDFWGDYNHLGFECEDGQRIAVEGRIDGHRRIENALIKDKEASMFFTIEEIESAKKFEERKKEQNKADVIDRNKRELERLKSQLETQ